MRRIALGLLALTLLVAASSDCLARGGGHGHGHGHGHSSGSTAHHATSCFSGAIKVPCSSRAVCGELCRDGVQC
jgi:hypothetical protein